MGQSKAECVESIIQVRAKTSLLDQRLQLQIARGDDPGFHEHCAVRSDGFKFSLFDDTQQLDLLIGSQHVNFVQQDCAIARDQKFAVFVSMGTCE